MASEYLRNFETLERTRLDGDCPGCIFEYAPEFLGRYIDRRAGLATDYGSARFWPIWFSNRSRSGCSVLSGLVPLGACVLCVLDVGT
jgi:hypothetical protein